MSGYDPYNRPFPVAGGTAARLGLRFPTPAVPTVVAPGRAAPPDRRGFDPEPVLRLLPWWGWTMVAYGDRSEPDVLVAHYVMGNMIGDYDYVDVFLARGVDRCAAYRARIWPGQDPLDVYAVIWCRIGDFASVLWELLNLRPVELGWPDFPHPQELWDLLPDAYLRSHRTYRPPQ